MIGGTLDFYFFSGPSPQKVVEQYGALVGLPTWQPSFGFGFHLCRWGYSDVNETALQVEKMREANIPLEGAAGYNEFHFFFNEAVWCSHVERYRSISRRT